MMWKRTTALILSLAMAILGFAPTLCLQLCAAPAPEVAEVCEEPQGSCCAPIEAPAPDGCCSPEPGPASTDSGCCVYCPFGDSPLHEPLERIVPQLPATPFVVPDPIIVVLRSADVALPQVPLPAAAPRADGGIPLHLLCCVLLC